MKRFTTLFSKKTTTFLLIFMFVSNFLHAQIVNEGVLKIKDGTTVYFGENYTNKAGATLKNKGELHLNGDTDSALRMGVNMHGVKYARRVRCNQGHWLCLGSKNLVPD